MRINYPTLLTLVPEAKTQLKAMHPGLVLKIIHKNYCAPMTVAGACPGMCALCEWAFAPLSDIGNARSRPALLAWMMRDAFSRRPIEQRDPQEAGGLDDLLRQVQEAL